MTASTHQRPAIRRVNYVIVSAQHQIYLGNVHRQGVTAVHRAARTAVLDHGRIAIFIGANGEAAAYSYRHVDYDRHCRKHAVSLVGVYELSASGKVTDTNDVALLADIRCHVLALPNEGAKAA
ncbi:hypothetical protein L2Y96_18115 [Luteibacter aegosomaticola]|uniref:hypothetical protein n=1 Tax=Luteibacter aegosomaticola TaxID=2911538 RepID=UPI001FF8AB19|nr:hypothetical protein [Luteibacter aegosomaticola]UPG89294.1 hypothetical protein L2Y96_18115 [Luteibacter aegosomaticola]